MWVTGCFASSTDTNNRFLAHYQLETFGNWHLFFVFLIDCSISWCLLRCLEAKTSSFWWWLFFVRSHIVVNLDGFENLMYLTCTIFVVIHVLIPILVVRNGLKDFGARAQDEVAVPVLFTSRAQASFANPWRAELEPIFSARFELDSEVIFAFERIKKNMKRVCTNTGCFWKIIWISVEFCQILNQVRPD